jgi:hypothetical protein
MHVAADLTVFRGLTDADDGSAQFGRLNLPRYFRTWSKKSRNQPTPRGAHCPFPKGARAQAVAPAGTKKPPSVRVS